MCVGGTEQCCLKGLFTKEIGNRGSYHLAGFQVLESRINWKRNNGMTFVNFGSSREQSRGTLSHHVASPFHGLTNSIANVTQSTVIQIHLYGGVSMRIYIC